MSTSMRYLDHDTNDDPDADDADVRDMPAVRDMNAGDDDSVDTEPCPFCHKPVYEQAEVCPHCRHYLSAEEIHTRKPLWFIITAIVCLLLIVLLWVLQPPG